MTERQGPPLSVIRCQMGIMYVYIYMYVYICAIKTEEDERDAADIAQSAEKISQ